MMNNQCLRRDDPGTWLRVLTFAGVLLADPCFAQAAPPQGGNAVGKKPPAASAAVSTAQENPRLVEWPGMYWEGHLSGHMREKPEWHATAEAVRIADNVLLYQCDSGGWPKTLAFKKRYDITALVSDADRPSIAALKSRTDSTIDNASTYTEIEFLARAFNATKQARFKDGFLKGVDYLLKAQYENGGWPQFYPFPKDKAYLARIASNRDEKDYFLHITFNDEAMVNVLRLLRRIASDNPEYAFVDADRRARCGKAVAKGIECILKCQVVVDGKRTGWCSQHNERTLAPAGARVYEKASLSGSEAVGIVRFLMSIDAPTPAVVDAIQSAVAWFDAVKIKGLRVVDKKDPSLPKGGDRVVVADPAAEPLWARFGDLGTFKPIFCGNNGVAKHSLAEIEQERRAGYMWYCTTPADLLARDYPAWQKKWAPGKNVLEK
jgi:PelA/Pel-15E family pectate lyase